MYHEKHLSYAFNKVKDLATLARLKFVITSLVINLTASTVTLLLLVSYLCEIQSAYGPYHKDHMKKFLLHISSLNFLNKCEKDN